MDTYLSIAIIIFSLIFLKMTQIVYLCGSLKSWFKKHKESWLLTFVVDFGIEVLTGIITAIQEAITTGDLTWAFFKGAIYAVIVSTVRQVARDQLEKSKEKINELK